MPLKELKDKFPHIYKLIRDQLIGESEKDLRCPHCDEKSGRIWFTGGYVKCWNCNKMSNYIDWFHKIKD